MTPALSLHGVGPTRGQQLALSKMLRSLLGGIDFDRLCSGMKVGAIDGDILQIFVPAGDFPSDIALRHSEDFAVAAEYVLGRPIRKVDVLSAG
jgi:hypothetical protein